MFVQVCLYVFKRMKNSGVGHQQTQNKTYNAFIGRIPVQSLPIRISKRCYSYSYLSRLNQDEYKFHWWKKNIQIHKVKSGAMLHKSMISVFPLESIYMYVEMNTSNKYTQGTFYIFTKEIIWFKQYRNWFYY